MRVEINLIGGDIYVNNRKIAFAVPFDPDNPHLQESATKYKVYTSVDWLLGWVKVGLMSQGHYVPHFPLAETDSFEAVEPHLEVKDGAEK